MPKTIKTSTPLSTKLANVVSAATPPIKLLPSARAYHRNFAASGKAFYLKRPVPRFTPPTTRTQLKPNKYHNNFSTSGKAGFLKLRKPTQRLPSLGAATKKK